VCDQETSKNEEAEVHYRAVKIQPQWVVTPGKQTKQTTIKDLYRVNLCELHKNKDDSRPTRRLISSIPSFVEIGQLAPKCK
jgi:hypothetical protein